MVAGLFSEGTELPKCGNAYEEIKSFLSESLHSTTAGQGAQWFFIFLKSVGIICCSLEFMVPLALVAFFDGGVRVRVGHR